MTPPSVPKVCRECKLYKPIGSGYELTVPTTKGVSIVGCLGDAPCAALELLQTIGAQSPSDCRSEEMCLLAERLRKESGA